MVWLLSFRQPRQQRQQQIERDHHRHEPPGGIHRGRAREERQAQKVEQAVAEAALIDLPEVDAERHAQRHEDQVDEPEIHHHLDEVILDEPHLCAGAQPALAPDRTPAEVLPAFVHAEAAQEEEDRHAHLEIAGDAALKGNAVNRPDRAEQPVVFLALVKNMVPQQQQKRHALSDIGLPFVKFHGASAPCFLLIELL